MAQRRPTAWLSGFVLAILFSVSFTAAIALPGSGLLRQRSWTGVKQGVAREILKAVYEQMNIHYYDLHFHGEDFSARFAEMGSMMQRATSMSQAMTIAAALLEPLNDPHVFFLPPGYRGPLIEYGFRFMMVGSDCYVTEIASGSDAARKLHVGERLLSVEGEPITRENLWKVEYNLNVLSPRTLLHAGIEQADEPAGNAAEEKKGRSRSGDPDTGEGEVIVKASMSSASNNLHPAEVFGQMTGRYVSRTAEFSKEGVLIWKIPRFPLDSDDAAAKWELAKKYKSLVLDLRGTAGEWNRGGDNTLGNLMGKDTQVGQRITRNGSEPYVVKVAKMPFRGKLVLLVDSGTSASSEILARVAQVQKRGMVIGDRTAGAATESKMFSCATGGEAEAEAAHVSISVAEIRMSDGSVIGREGVTPDEIVLPSQDDLKMGRDPQLARAAALAGLAIDSTASGKMFPPH